MSEPGAPTTGSVDLTSLSYEQAEAELVELIGKLETGDVPLEDSLQMWERATQLREVCAKLLTDARTRLTAGAAAAGVDATQPTTLAAVPPVAEEDPWASAPTNSSGTGDKPPF